MCDLLQKNLTPLPTGRQATPLLKAEGSNGNFLLNGNIE